MAAKKAEPKPERPPLAWPEQFRSDAIARALQIYPNDMEAALKAAERYARFVLGKNAHKETPL